MKKIITTYCLLLAVISATAQKQANAWYFGNNVGLDFNQTPPKPVQGTAASLEGCASIADNNGKLLFYTNGLVVINRKHSKMLNGDNLMGDLSSTDNAVIVPQPSNDSIYYLFTIGAQGQAGKGLRYSIINMHGDGGYGEVVQKNIILENNTFEKLAAVKHCNKKDVWLMIHQGSSDEYHAYLLTAAGINTTPVISNTGFAPSNPIGTLKFSGDGTKLVAVYSFETNTVVLMKFDNTNGTLTTPVTFQPEAVAITDNLYTEAYGAEFSPSGNLLYISAGVSDVEPSKLFQFDISSFNVSAIMASKQVIASTTPWFAGGLQIGTDQKIYMSMYKDSSISVIDNPDVYGAGCNFIFNKIFMGSGFPMQFGLPTFVQSYFYPSSNPYDFERSGNCSDLDVQFNIDRLTGINSVTWDFGDGQTSTSLSPTNHYAAPGFYNVKLTVSKVLDCSGTSEVITHKIWVAPATDLLGKDTGSCAAPVLQIGIDDIVDASYLWNTGAATSKITVSSFGKYWLHVEYGGCSISDTINVNELPKPIANAGKDTTVCMFSPVLLSAATPTASSYLWSTGETSSTIKVNTAGIYSVDVTGNSCTVSDSVVVGWGDCDLYIPNAFLPTGRNNLFGVVGGFASHGFEMRIFDRWGNTVFTASDPSQKWDGTYKGKIVPQGAYTWTLAWVDKHGYKQFLQGSVMLIR